MAGFKRHSGAVRTEWYPKKASTAMVYGDLLIADGSGRVTKATSTSTVIVGVCLKTIASTDTDYASTTYVPVMIPTENTLFTAPVGTGTFTDLMIGNKYDLKDENEIDVSAQSHKVVTIAKYLSATLAAVKINASQSYVNGV